MLQLKGRSVTSSARMWLGVFIPLLVWGSAASAQISLGTAESFGVLAGSTVTNTGASVVVGNLGTSPGTAITGFPPGVVTPPGVIHSADAVAAQAQADLTTAYNAVAATPTLVDLTGIDLGGLTLTPGVYGFSSSAQLTGTLTLDAQGNPDALFLFKIGSALTTASGSSVVVINGGSACNVYWQAGSSATLGTGTAFVGNILALASVTLNSGATLAGRALARNGAVTLQSNNVAVCPSAPPVCPTVVVNPATLPSAIAGTPYAQVITASGGTAPYAYTLSSGALPPGLSLNPVTGAITGTPTTFGTFNFTITATDANGCPGSRAYTMLVAAPLCPAISLLPVTLPTGPIGSPYSQAVTASGGQAPYSYVVSSGALPSGLTLGLNSGIVAGTPTTAGIFSFTITATDANACPGSRAYVIAIAAVVCPAITLAPATLPPSVIGVPYSQVLVASGGVPPYAYSVTSGALPNGLTLNGATGALTGTPTTTGIAHFTITAADANGCLVSVVYALSVTAAVCPAITLSPSTLPAPVLGMPYSQTLAASGGLAPYAYAITAGALPAGLTLNAATGAISGTPSLAGSYSFTVTATDANGCPVNVAYPFIVMPAVCPAVTIGPSTLPVPVFGVPYSQTLVATGGLAPYAYAVTAGALPSGLTLNAATGTISGTPNLGGSYSFTVTATDANGCAASITYAVAVAAGPVAGPDEPIPTLSEWALIVLAMLAAMVGMRYLRRT